MSAYGGYVSRAGGAGLGNPYFDINGLAAGRVTSGAPARYDSIPNTGDAGGNVTPISAGASRPLLSSWGAIANATPYFDTSAAGFVSSLAAAAFSFFAASSTELVDGTAYIRFYVDPGAAASGSILVTQTNGSNQGFWLRRDAGVLKFSASGAGSATTLTGGALAVNTVNDVIVTKTASGSGTTAYEMFVAVGGGALTSVATGSKANHGTDATLVALTIGGGTGSLIGAFPLVRIYKGVAANEAQRALILEQGRQLFAA